MEQRSIAVPGVGSWLFNIYLPPGYDASSERYPVVYLFRGAVDEWMNRSQDASRGGRNIQDIADSLTAQGTTGKMILVMPGFTAMTGPASDDDYAFILNTLIPWIDRQYRTLPSRWFRGVDGFSLGGLHMVNLIWRNPERFASAGSYDGTVSMFNFNQVIAAGEPYFARIRRMQFLLHSAAIAPSNLVYNQQFESMLNSIGIRNGFPDLLFSPLSQHNWWYADEHMMRSLPLHWAKFHAPPHSVAVRWSTIIPQKASGTVHLSWSIPVPDDSLKLLIDVSRDAGTTWQTLLFSSATESSFEWDTQMFRDGTRFLLRAQVFGDTSYGVIESDRFTVDNPGNSAPDIALLTPANGETITGLYPITWSAADPEGDIVRCSIEGSSDNGITWQTIAIDLPNTGSYSLNSQAVSNASSYLIKIRASDGVLASEAISGSVRIQNARSTLGGLKHVSGTGDGTVTADIVDPSRLTGHVYRVEFNDTSASRKTYSVIDKTRNSVLVSSVAYSRDGTEGPMFDGLRLAVVDPPAVVNNRDSTRWTKGSSTLSAVVSTPVIYAGPDTIRGIAYPADYEIRISDRVVDTSSSYLGAAPTPIYFTVWNVTEHHRVDVVFGELDNNGRISRFDELYILEKTPGGQQIVAWEIFFSGDDRAILPSAGDVFSIGTTKPLRSGDMFEFTSIASSLPSTTIDLPFIAELSQNFPNPFNPRTTIQYRLSSGGETDICVYDLLGRKVAVLLHSIQTKGTHTLLWDASGLSSGLYVYRLRSGSTIITKTALFLK
ncbi:MAG TPA: alpha/beta hydrolase-fold protein [Bacteroidota bacterium]|nr:alpha/beta hydrolase-fold protein [Bacteroidota bacterium]